MAVTSYLVDKSVLSRLDKPAVLAALQPYIGRLATCSTVVLELGWSARNAKHYQQIVDDLAWYEALEISQSTLNLATALQGALVRRGDLLSWSTRSGAIWQRRAWRRRRRPARRSR